MAEKADKNELEALRRELRLALEGREAAEKESKQKDEFLAVLSHELRTPLHAVLGWIQLVRRRRLSQDELDYSLNVIEGNAKSQAKLISDLLDISRVNSGKMALSLTAINLPDLIEEAINGVSPQAEAKKLEIKWVLCPKLVPVWGDKDRVKQVVSNLLGNAIKFTPERGKIMLVVDRLEDAIELSVTDNGEGISSDFLPHVFERFRSGTSATKQGKGAGLGLGLFLVKHIVQAHGGTVSAASDGEGKGATFRVTLPVLGKGEFKLLQGLRKEPGEAGIDGLKILVVDDEKDARELLFRALSDKGALVTTACLAEEALSILEATAPELLISDISMPEVDGYALLTEIRNRGYSAEKLPAIAVTACAQDDDVKRARVAGFQLHLAKPVDLEELVSNISKLTRR